MTDNENWRLERAAKLGLEPYGHALVKLAPVHPDPRPDAAAPPGLHSFCGTPGRSDDVIPMRRPVPAPAAIETLARRIAPEQSGLAYRPSAGAMMSKSPGERGLQRDAPRQAGWGPAARASLYVAGTAAAAAVAAAGGAWFAIRHNQAPPPVPEIAQLVPRAGPVVAPAMPPQLAVAEPDSAAAFANRCADPKIIAGVRAAAGDRLRQSAVDRNLTIGRLTAARSKLAGADGSLTLCTAVLDLQRSGGRLAGIDIDYAVRTTAGSSLQLVPLGLNYALDRIASAEPVVSRRVPVETAAYLGPAVPVPSAAVAQAPASEVAPPRIVVSKQSYAGSALGYAPASLNLSTAALDRTVETFEARPGPVRVPRGCDRATTRSVSMTCKDPTLLAMNATVRTTLAQIDPARNRAALARIKASADKRFDRCTSVSCTENAYRYWLDALARLNRGSEPGTELAGQRTGEGQLTAASLDPMGNK